LEEFVSRKTYSRLAKHTGPIKLKGDGSKDKVKKQWLAGECFIKDEIQANRCGLKNSSLFSLC
jgi:hypothetical protein